MTSAYAIAVDREYSEIVSRWEDQSAASLLSMVRMTELEALEEAKRRWGENAYVRYRPGILPVSVKPCVVGKRVGHGSFLVFGQGETWEEAFAHADKRRK